MKKSTLFLLLFLTFFTLNGTPKDLLPSPEPIGLKKVKSQNSWLQYGFRIGYQLPMMKQYSATDDLERLFSADFAGFLRVGKYIWGEIGLGYCFYKGHYYTTIPNLPIDRDVVETRFLEIPIKIISKIDLTERWSILPSAGIIYQPLIQVSQNYINYSRNNIEPNQLLWSVGFGTNISFIYAEVAYKKSITHFFTDRKSAYPDFINISLGFVF